MRRIVCNKCFKQPLLHPEDVALGFHARHKVIEQVKRPEGLCIEVGPVGGKKVTTEIPQILCDSCGEVIEDGQSCHAVTVWRGGNEIAEWENEYESR